MVSSSPRSADLGAEAAETLRCARSGGPGPSAEAAATSERSERERVAVRFAVEAVACGAVGCRESDGLLELCAGEERRVLCPEHAAGWSP